MKPKKRNSKIVMVRDAITIIICNVLTGLLIASVNVTESSLTQGLTDALMVSLLTTYGLIFLLRFILRCAEKDIRTEIMNTGLNDHYDKSLKSSVSAIQEVSVGTIFDAVRELLNMKGGYVVSLT